MGHDDDPDDLNEFDAALYKLVEAGRKTPDQALSEADEPDKLGPLLEKLAKKAG